MNQPHETQSIDDPPAHWPKDVRPISWKGLSALGVDSEGGLYWDGKSVEVRKTFSLSFWQRVGTVAVTSAAVIGAASAAISAYADIAAMDAIQTHSSPSPR